MQYYIFITQLRQIYYLNYKLRAILYIAQSPQSSNPVGKNFQPAPIDATDEKKNLLYFVVF